MTTSHRRWSAEQKREFVLEYSALPYGQRGAFARKVGVDSAVLNKWRRQLAAGTLESGLIPRNGRLSMATDNREIARLVQEKKELEAKLAKAEQEKESQARVIDALGKAIELLRDVRRRQSS